MVSEDKRTLQFEPLGPGGFGSASAVCIGSGRFLRTVLIPALVELGEEVIVAQTRGTSFGKYMSGQPEWSYEVDTVLQDGSVRTARIPVAACGTLGSAEGREAFMRLPTSLPKLRYIGLGLTEAGIAHNATSIVDVAEFLHQCFQAGLGAKFPLSLLNTDNMPFNGDAIKKHVCNCDFSKRVSSVEAFQTWLQTSVLFHNTMVDGITSQRKGNPDVPRAEPLPTKALVIEDLTGGLPEPLKSLPGVVVRTKPGQLAVDLALKLRVANGTHTAMVYAMALGRLFRTDCCIGRADILPYLERLFEFDIVHVCDELPVSREQVTAVFNEWMARLQHPHFGLECMFVCQNATQKMGIRLLPSIKATVATGKQPSDFMAFALAVILRFLTPIGDQSRSGEKPPVFLGQLDRQGEGEEPTPDDVEYTTGLWLRPRNGTYEFKDADGEVPLLLRPLGQPGRCTTAAVSSIVGEVLARLEGFDANAIPEHRQLAATVADMLHRLLNEETALKMLSDLQPQDPASAPAQKRRALNPPQ